MSPILTCVLVAVGALCLLVLGAAYLFFRTAFYQRRPNADLYVGLDGETNFFHVPDKSAVIELLDRVQKIPCEEVRVTSFDGLSLSARYYHVKDGAPTVILCHGYRAMALRDFCGGLPELLSRGYNALLIDERACGKSEGRVITFGVRERRDLVSWISYLNERFSSPKILLYGISMGAATVLMSLSLDLPDNVVGAVADYPYTDPEAIIRKVGGDRKLPVSLCMPIAKLGARLFGRLRLSDASALKAVKQNTRVPILLIHGDADGFVPYSMSKSIAESNPALVDFLTVKGADHAVSYLYDTEAYLGRLDAFLKRINP